MASDAFLNSIEVNFKKAADYVQKTYGAEVLSQDLANQIMMANATYVVRFGVRLRGTVHTFTGYRSVHSDHFEPVKVASDMIWLLIKKKLKLWLL